MLSKHCLPPQHQIESSDFFGQLKSPPALYPSWHYFMKRSFWRKKKTIPLKKTPLKKKSKSPIRKLQDDLWKECRRIANTLYKPQNGVFRCFTCNNEISGSNKQLGHFLPKSVCGAFLKYDLRNLRWQCYMCNIHLSGNGAVFYRKLVEIEGQEYVDKIFADKLKTVKAHDFYIELLAQYSKL
jgi:hypothetical protein